MSEDKVTESVTSGRGGYKGGSRKGIPNKATSAAREAIAAFVDGNAPRLQAWLDDVAADEPEKAFRLFMDVVEYHIPKLARTEHTGKDGGAIIVQAANGDESL